MCHPRFLRAYNFDFGPGLLTFHFKAFTLTSWVVWSKVGTNNEQRTNMALRWDTSAVENPPHLDKLLVKAHRDRWARKLESMIWASMAVDMPGFGSESETDEFFNRYAVWCIHKGLDPEFTLDDCKHYIGLRTNVERSSRFAWDAKQRKMRGVK